MLYRPPLPQGPEPVPASLWRGVMFSLPIALVFWAALFFVVHLFNLWLWFWVSIVLAVAITIVILSFNYTLKLRIEQMEHEY
jgi:hypothetical protein